MDVSDFFETPLWLTVGAFISLHVAHDIRTLDRVNVLQFPAPHSALLNGRKLSEIILTAWHTENHVILFRARLLAIPHIITLALTSPGLPAD